MQPFRMPALGADMEQGRLVQWLVAPGSRVKAGDIVAVVETQKGAIDVEIFADGILDALVPLGTELPVGGVLAQVLQEGETAAAPAAAPAPAPGPAQAPPAAPLAPAARVRATPGARERAHALGVDLARVRGTGPQQGITLADVEQAAIATRAAPAAAPVTVRAPAPRGGGFDPAQMRAAIAAAMARSHREIPHYYLEQAIDFGAAQDWLAAYNAQRDPVDRLLPAVLLLKATALALAQVPQLNGFWRDGGVELAPSAHVGWAISLRGGGLVAPAVHDVQRKNLPELMTALRDLVQRARTGGLRSSELADSTVTVTNLGDRGADSVLGVIYPPQLALVGFGRIALRPWVRDGQVVARPVVQASLAADHRASDGHVGAQFLAALDAALQQPERLQEN